MIDERLLKSEEKAVYSLRSLYRKYGYKPFKMSKFEEYELYIRNKDFLVSDRIITFNDTNGKLLALKPDVTLSIIKNGDDNASTKQKVYYNENVYRVSEGTGQYKEIMQAGLECIGDIDIYDIYETLLLAAKSLATVSENFVLEISSLDVLLTVLESVCQSKAFQTKAIGFISEKNSHDLKRLCEEYDCLGDFEKLSVFITAYGNPVGVIRTLGEVVGSGEALVKLKDLTDMLSKTEFADKVIIDFSVVNDMNYYNGIVFKGFLDGICEGVLAGGQYDRMMKKMGRKSGAIGFALYLDLLEQLNSPKDGYDADVLLLYSDKTDRAFVAKKVEEIISKGKSVSAQKSVVSTARYKEIIELKEEA